MTAERPTTERLREACAFGPPHEPFYCRIHGDVRLTLDAERCRTGVRLAAAPVDRDGLREALVTGVEALEDPWPVPGAREDDPRDDWCRKRDVLALIDAALSAPEPEDRP